MFISFKVKYSFVIINVSDAVTSNKYHLYFHFIINKYTELRNKARGDHCLQSALYIDFAYALCSPYGISLTCYLYPLGIKTSSVFEKRC